MKNPVIFARDEHVYMVGPVAPFVPESAEVEAYAFAEDLKKVAPNPNIKWLRGQYVEADTPNRNGHQWTGDEIAIKSLTPMLMPVTVMHDPRTAVGLIADVKLVLPGAQAADGQPVPRARIDSTLAQWQHRFPEVAEEIDWNYQQGTLMQSMEALPQHYDCAGCGLRFPWMGMTYEDPNWCEHMKARTTGTPETNGNAIRTLGNVTFTGVGLIFGTRGARGAYDKADLEVIAAEVTEFHQKAKRDTGTPRKTPRSARTMEIEDKVYEELVAARSERDTLKTRIPDLEAQAAEATKVPTLEKQLETVEAEKAAEKKRADDAEAELTKAEEKDKADALAKERFNKLGGGFKSALGEFTRPRLEAQAGTLKDDEWDARLTELEETMKVKRDEGGEEAAANDDTFSRDAVASSQLGGGGGNGGGGTATKPSQAALGSVVRGLIPTKSTTKK